MRKRLRDYPSAAELAVMYAEPHRHTQFDDHVIRVDVTSAIAHSMIKPGNTVADLSCGDGTIVNRLEISHGAVPILGDYAPGYAITGPIHETITQLGDGSVDLFVCTETIEHVDDVEALLQQIRRVSARLLLSTPDGAYEDTNPEHIWAWDMGDVAELLMATNWNIELGNLLDLRMAGFMYAYQIWGCT